MKTGLTIAIAALGLAIFAVPDTPAQAWGGWDHGPNLDQRIAGSSLTIEVDEDGNTQVMLNLIARGQPGRAHLDSVAVFGPVGPHPSCPGQLGADIVSQNAVETFSDGSLLTLLTTSGFVCTADGVVFTAVATGDITGGAGRFEGATGTFEANVVTENGGLTGTITGDID